MVNPCFKTKMRRQGIDVEKNREALEMFIRKNSTEIEEIIDTAQFALDIIGNPSPTQRRELYQIGLNSCLNQ